MLEDHAEAATLGRQRIDPLVAQADGAGIGPLETGDDAQQRRLAAARRSEQRQDLAGSDLERDAFEDRLVAEALGDALEPERRQPPPAAAPRPRTVRSQSAIHSCAFAAANASS